MGYGNQACYAFGYPRLVKLLHVAINRQFNTIQYFKQIQMQQGNKLNVTKPTCYLEIKRVTISTTISCEMLL